MPLRGEVKRTIVIANEKTNVQAAESCDNFLSEAGYELCSLAERSGARTPKREAL